MNLDIDCYMLLQTHRLLTIQNKNNVINKKKFLKLNFGHDTGADIKVIFICVFTLLYYNVFL